MTQLTDRPRLATEVELVAPVDAHEGPTYVAEEDALYFTTPPSRTDGAPLVAIRRLALDGDRFPLAPERVSTVVADANVANGMTIDADGALVVCEQGSLEADAAITRIDRVTAPVLVIHCEADATCPVAHGEAIHAALRQLGREVEFLRVPAEGHFFNVFGALNRRLERTAALDEFLVRHLQPLAPAIGTNREEIAT